MRLVIGYQDGECSDAAIDDLARAGLAESEVEARVIGVAPIVAVAVDPEFEKRSPALAWLARDRQEYAQSEAEAAAKRGAQRLSTLMPRWNVQASAVSGVTYRALTEAAESWPADLLVVGSHGRGALGRLFLGSVAQMCANHCRRSVRIARGSRSGGTATGGLRLMVADDGSPTAEAAVKALAGRTWPAGTEVLVVFVVDLPLTASGVGLGPDASAFTGELAEARRDLETYGKHLTETTTQTLRKAGLIARPLVIEGRPRYAITELAQREGVDCIFLGAVGHRAMERILLGSVASGVAAGAACSVELIRPEVMA